MLFPIKLNGPSRQVRFYSIVSAAAILGIFPQVSQAQFGPGAPAMPATGLPGDLGTLGFPYVVGAPYQLNDMNNPNSVWWQLRVLQQMEMRSAVEQANMIREMQGMLRVWNANLQTTQKDLETARTAFEPIVKERDKCKADLKFSERDSRDAVKDLERIEQRVLAELPPDSDYVQKRNERQDFLKRYDDLIVDILNLPVRKTARTEEQLATERFRYTPEQKARLNENTEYLQMTAELPKYNMSVAEAQQKALADNSDWTLANEKNIRLHKQTEDLKASLKLITTETNQKRAVFEMARNRNLFAQQSVRTLQMNLRKMGAGTGQP